MVREMQVVLSVSTTVIRTTAFTSSCIGATSLACTLLMRCWGMRTMPGVETICMALRLMRPLQEWNSWPTLTVLLALTAMMTIIAQSRIWDVCVMAMTTAITLRQASVATVARALPRMPAGVTSGALVPTGLSLTRNS